MRSVVRVHAGPLKLLFGAVAQLGERLTCTEEVAGSIPVGSTMFLVVFFSSIVFSNIVLMFFDNLEIGKIKSPVR